MKLVTKKSECKKAQAEDSGDMREVMNKVAQSYDYNAVITSRAQLTNTATEQENTRTRFGIAFFSVN